VVRCGPVQVKPDTIIQVWSGDSYNIDHVTQSGFRALFSTCWYLDYINYGQDWDKYYNCEQISKFTAFSLASSSCCCCCCCRDEPVRLLPIWGDKMSQRDEEFH